MSVGQQLKKARARLAWSLSRAAKETGVSKAMLGQIERGESSPTVATLWKIATGFHLPLSSLIESEGSPTDLFVPAKRTSLKPNHELAVHPLFTFDPRFGFELFQIELEPGQTHLSEAHDEGVTEHIIVTTGKVEVLLDDKWRPLNTEEALRFSANKPHGYRNITKKMAVFHCLIHYPS